MRKTYKIVYSVRNQPGTKVTFVDAYNENDARTALYREHGGYSAFETGISGWDVKEMNF